jgi:uncharacterized protein YtpQ (UPF0354 family)
MLKNVLKFLAVGVGIAVLGWGLMYGLKYFKYQNDPDYRAVLEMEKLNKLYAQDSFGGETPEETLRLVIDALKIGDTDLAAKYFVMDKQSEWKQDLAKIKEKGILENMIGDLENKKEDKVDENTGRYFITAKDGLSSPLVLVKSINGRWKIRTL